MNLKTKCCNADLVNGYHHENPLGPREFNGVGITYKTEICADCGKEDPTMVELCDICGEPAERFVNLDGDDYCPHCFEERLQEAINELKRRTGLGDKTA